VPGVRQVKRRKPDPDLLDAFTGKRMPEPTPTIVRFMRRMEKFRPHSGYLCHSSYPAKGTEKSWRVTIEWGKP
jgi:hypothetical protein